MRRAAPAQTAAPRSDREVLEAAHEFLPEASREAEPPAPTLSGADAARARAAAGDAAHAARLAAAYDARLFREFALVDLSRRVPASLAAGSALPVLSDDQHGQLSQLARELERYTGAPPAAAGAPTPRPLSGRLGGCRPRRGR
jgi:hypothetical protein